MSVTLIGNTSGLMRLQINNSTKTIEILSEWKENAQMFSEAKQQLCEYYEGTRTGFSIKLNLEGTEFQKSVWNNLTHIPYCEAYSYKQITEMVENPNASRAVGMANN